MGLMAAFSADLLSMLCGVAVGDQLFKAAVVCVGLFFFFRRLYATPSLRTPASAGS